MIHGSICFQYIRVEVREGTKFLGNISWRWWRIKGIDSFKAFFMAERCGSQTCGPGRPHPVLSRPLHKPAPHFCLFFKETTIRLRPTFRLWP